MIQKPRSYTVFRDDQPRPAHRSRLQTGTSVRHPSDLPAGEHMAPYFVQCFRRDALNCDPTVFQMFGLWRDLCKQVKEVVIMRHQRSQLV